MTTTQWVVKNHGLSAIAREHDLRLRRIEKRLFGKTKRYAGMPKVCDAPRCSKPPTFQCGRRFDGLVGSWCGEECFSEFSL